VPPAAYEKKIKDYVENMLKAKDIKPDQKKVVLRFLASAEERSSKLYTARTMLQRSINLNPTDLKVRLQLGQLEESAGRFLTARKVYEDALATKVMDPPTEKQIYVRLLRLYSLLGEKKKQSDLVVRALALFPNDAEIKAFQSKRLPASVKKQ
jgi:tetratricopeptide (TPR) repeat protein